jgi:hypothetical protein
VPTMGKPSRPLGCGYRCGPPMANNAAHPEPELARWPALLPLAAGTLGRRARPMGLSSPAAGGVELPLGRRARPVGSSSRATSGARAPPAARTRLCPRWCATSDLGWRRRAPWWPCPAVRRLKKDLTCGSHTSSSAWERKI